MRTSRTRTRGAAFPLALFLLFVTFTAVAVVARSALDDAHDTLRERAELTALHAGDGALEAARHRLAADPAYTGSTVSVGRHAVDVTVTAIAPDTRAVVVETSVPVAGATGLPVRRRFEQTLRLGEGLPAVTSWRELR